MDTEIEVKTDEIEVKTDETIKQGDDLTAATAALAEAKEEFAKEKAELIKAHEKEVSNLKALLKSVITGKRAADEHEKIDEIVEKINKRREF